MALSSSRKNLPAAAATVVVVFLLLVVATTAGGGGGTLATTGGGESSAAAFSMVVATTKENRCRHLSGSYKGICAYSLSCYFVCKDESKDNVDGSCDWLQCWCYTNCGTSSSEIIAASPAPIQP